MQHTKQCAQCMEAKGQDQYENRRSNHDGKDNLCKSCRNQWRVQQEQTPQGMYALKARLLTTIVKYRYFRPYDKQAYQLDHKFSISKAYQRQVPIQVVCNKSNLQLLTTEDNRRKGEKCSISIFDLFETYKPDAFLERAAKAIEGKSYEQLKVLSQKYHQKNIETELLYGQGGEQ